MKCSSFKKIVNEIYLPEYNSHLDLIVLNNGLTVIRWQTTMVTNVVKDLADIA